VDMGASRHILIPGFWSGAGNRRFWKSKWPPPTGKPTGKGGGRSPPPFPVGFSVGGGRLELDPKSRRFPARFWRFYESSGETAETDGRNLELYGVATVCKQLFYIIGKTIEKEPLRFLSTITAAGSSGGVAAGQGRYTNGIMEHKVSQNLRVETKVCSRHWHQKFTAALGQVRREYEEIVYKLVKETDLGKELDKIVAGLNGECGGVFEISIRRCVVYLDRQGGDRGARQNSVGPSRRA
jgi:hypothetical protein